MPTEGDGMDRRSWRHYIEMVIAMVVGMTVLEPLRSTLMPEWRVPAVVTGPEALCLFMATEMSAGMWLWMRIRGYAARETLPMFVGMYASFVVLFPLLWVDLISEATLLVAGHLIMLTVMWVLVRRHASARGSGPRALGRQSEAADPASTSAHDSTRRRG